MGDTIEDKEIEQKDHKMEFLENKIGLPDSKVIEQIRRLGLNKISTKRKGNRIIHWLNISPINWKYIENKKQ